jgi:hypothetical protein
LGNKNICPQPYVNPIVKFSKALLLYPGKGSITFGRMLLASYIARCFSPKLSVAVPVLAEIGSISQIDVDPEY